MPHASKPSVLLASRTLCAVLLLSTSVLGGPTCLSAETEPMGSVRRIGETRYRHSGIVSCVSVAPDGKHVATVSEDSVGWVWETSKGLLAQKFDHTPVYGISFAPDSKTIALGVPNHVLLWELGAASPKKSLRVFFPIENDEAIEASPSHLSFSADGHRLATDSFDPKDRCSEILVWDIGKDTIVLRRQLKSPPHSLSLSDNGQKIAVGDLDGVTTFIHVETGKVEKTFREANNDAIVRFVSGGQQVVEAHSKWKSIILRDGAQFKELGRLRSEVGVYSLAASTDGKLIACTDTLGQRVEVWDLTTMKLIQTIFTTNSGGTPVVAFLPGTRLLVGRKSKSHALHFWDTESKKELPVNGPLATVTSVQFAPDGRSAVIDAGESLYEWNESKPGLTSLFSKNGGQCATCFVGNKNEIAICYSSIDSVNLKKGDVTIKLTIDKKDAPLTDAIGISSDCSQVAVATSKTVNVWIVESKQLVNQFPVEDPVCRLLFSPDGLKLAAGTDNGILYVWDFTDGDRGRTIVRRHQVSSVKLTAIAFSSDSQLVAVPIDDKSILMMDLLVGKAGYVIKGAKEAVEALAFSRDDSMLFAGAARGFVAWRIFPPAVIGRFNGHNGKVVALAQSSNGNLLTGSADTTALMWNIEELNARGEVDMSLIKDSCRSLGSRDAIKGNLAALALISGGQKTVEILAHEVCPAASIEEEHIRELINRLDSAEFEVRKKAYAELRKLDTQAISLIKKTISNSPEVAARLKELTESIWTSPDDSIIHNLRAVRVLEHIPSEESLKLMKKLAEGAKDARLTKAAQLAYGRMRLSRHSR